MVLDTGPNGAKSVDEIDVPSGDWCGIGVGDSDESLVGTGLVTG